MAYLEKPPTPRSKDTTPGSQRKGNRNFAARLEAEGRRHNQLSVKDLRPQLYKTASDTLCRSVIPRFRGHVQKKQHYKQQALKGLR
jgi:hypothetical protein